MIRKIAIFLFFTLTLLSAANAQIAIRSFEYTPEKISPGENLQLIIHIVNVGDDDIKNISLKLILDNLPFAPLRSSTEKILDELEKNEENIITFNLATLPDSTPQIYKIPVKLSYGSISKESLISIEVNAEPKLSLILEDTDLIKVNDNGIVAIKLINEGLIQIKFLTLTLQENSDAYEIVSANTVYIGDIDIGDFESEEFNIIPKIENPQLAFTVNYKDSRNNELVQSKNIKLNVYNEAKAKELGLVEKSILPTVIIIVVIVLAVIFIYRMVRKRKNAG